jgi:uncharacterized protein DUF4331
MSHHLDSPIARQDIRLDITDLYVFRGETGTVFVINVCHSIFGPIPAPGYHPEGMYEFKVDLNGDAVEDVTYRITFDARDSRGKQRYVIRCIRGAEAVDPHAPGTVVAQGTTGETVTTASGLCIWTGKAGDPFWIEPDVLHAVGDAFQDGKSVDLSGWDPSHAKNLFAGHTVYSIVLEVPDGELLAATGDKRRIGVWAVSTLATNAGGWRQINRAGLPMMHPLSPSTTKTLATASTGGARPMTLRLSEKPSPRQSLASCPPMEPHKIPEHMGRKSRTGSCPTSCLTRWEQQPCSGLPNGTAAPSRTTRRT